MNIDTLRFVLKTSEDKIGFNANEILEQILQQRENFIKRFNIEPKYISIEDNMNNFLFEQIIKNIDIEKHYKYSPNKIYGMEIISRFEKDSLYMKDNEAICI